MIDRFKIDGDIYTVEFSNYAASYKIVCGETPQKELFQSAQILLFCALKLFGIDNLAALFLEIYLSNGEKRSSRLSLNVPTATSEFAKVQLPSVPRREVRIHETGQRANHPQNDYNDALDEFENQVDEYVKGRRQQLSLPFDLTPLTKDDDQSSDVAADRIIDFAKG